MNKVKVVMLAGKVESTVFMFNGVKDYFLIEKVILETGMSKKELLIRRVKSIGFMKVFGQLFFMLYNIWLKKISKKRIIEIKNIANLKNDAIDKEKIVEVSTINSKETIDALLKCKPDVVIVNGTRVISKEVLESINVPFINTHVGITPKYRGVHGGYWALTEKDYEHCGVTIHVVDIGIDTGGVLYQKIIEIDKNDTFNTYPYLQIAAAIPLMNKAIKDVAYNSIQIKNINLPSNFWTHPTIIEYFKYRIFRGVK